MPTDEQLRQSLRALLFDAVRAYLREPHPIGGSYAYEWSAAGRIAIHMARTRQALQWEYYGITVDPEYGQRGHRGMRKEDYVTGRGMRPDILIHRRGTDDHNWLACEVKLHGGAQPRRLKSDRIKLQSYKRDYNYQLAIWLSIPRTILDDAQVFYCEVENQEQGQFDIIPLCSVREAQQRP